MPYPAAVLSETLSFAQVLVVLHVELPAGSHRVYSHNLGRRLSIGRSGLCLANSFYPFGVERKFARDLRIIPVELGSHNLKDFGGSSQPAITLFEVKTHAANQYILEVQGAFVANSEYNVGA